MLLLRPEDWHWFLALGCGDVRVDMIVQPDDSVVVDKYYTGNDAYHLLPAAIKQQRVPGTLEQVNPTRP